MRSSRVLLTGLMAALLGSCGGGGGGGSGGGPPIGGGSGFTPGVFAAATSFEARCSAPRSGSDPQGRPWPDRLGTALDEKNWLRSWTHELYLWYREVADRDPAAFSVLDYFDLLKTPQSTASGQPKDRFHFAIPTNAWLQQSQLGSSAGYGLQWAILADTPPRELRVAYIEPGATSPAAAVGLARGARVLAIDGIDLVNSTAGADIDRLNDALFPSGTGQSHSFTVQDIGGGPQRSVSMTSANVTATPVQNTRSIATASGPVGYLLFNDHIATSEAGLVQAITTLRNAGVVDLVLDLRYNGGGLVSIGRDLASYVHAGRTSNQAFASLLYNDRQAPFYNTTYRFNAPSGALALTRVYVLQGPRTCSASEQVINALRPFVNVVAIGDTSCGKPVGFLPVEDGCGTTYSVVNFESVNANNEGRYFDGFDPTCTVAEDFTRALGSASEPLLAAAIDHADGLGCPVASAAPREQTMAARVKRWSAAAAEGERGVMIPR